MPPVKQRLIRWRVYIRIRGVKYFANRCSVSPLPRVAWNTYSSEYPDDFNRDEAQAIKDYYLDQSPVLDKCVLVANEED